MRSDGLSTRSTTREALGLLLLAAVACLVYVNALDGEFVYDDTRQIVHNDLIKDPRRLGTALTSDVWGFKGEKGAAWSNYWRPAFVLWLVANHRVFGLESTLGWHLGSVLLHGLVVLLSYILLRMLRLSLPVALAIALLFAVHPVHVESVAWISGAPDLILSAALLAALALLLIHLRALRAKRPLALLASLALYAIALLAKEIAVFFPLIVFAAAWFDGDAREPRAGRARRALLVVGPFLLLTAGYALAHYRIIGRGQIEVPWRVGASGILLTAPSLLSFYLRQCVFPLWLGPSYPPRAVAVDTLDLDNFWVPLLVVAGAVALLVWLARREPVRCLGLVLFFVPLLPALNIDAFKPEQLVHDRYLYLPLLGLLMVLVPALVDLLRNAAGFGADRAAWLTLGAAALCALPLGARTVQYNRAWRNELSLMEAGLRSDPGSATNLAEYARVLIQAGRLAEARPYLERALAIHPLIEGYMQRADLALAEQRYADAEADLQQILASYPNNTAAYERLSVCYQQQGRLADAERLLRTARVEAPHMHCAFTDRLAVILYLQNRKDEALAELESVRGAAAQEYGSGARSVLFHLGSLYAELGRREEARAALEEYLALTTADTDAMTRHARSEARSALAKLAG